MKRFIGVLLIVTVVTLGLFEMGYCDAIAVYLFKNANYATVALTNTAVKNAGNCHYSEGHNNAASAANCATVAGADFAHADATSSRIVGVATLWVRVAATAQGGAGPYVTSLADSTWSNDTLTATIDTLTDSLTVTVKGHFHIQETGAKSFLNLKIGSTTTPIGADTLSWISALPLLYTTNYSSDGVNTVKLSLTPAQETTLVIIAKADAAGGSFVTPFLGTWGILALLLLLAATAWYVLSRRKVRTTGSAA